MYGELSFTYFSVKWNSLEVIEILRIVAAFPRRNFKTFDTGEVLAGVVELSRRRCRTGLSREG
jgi:hypothetical protein